jgi:hypothetical protein
MKFEPCDRFDDGAIYYVRRAYTGWMRRVA